MTGPGDYKANATSDDVFVFVTPFGDTVYRPTKDSQALIIQSNLDFSKPPVPQSVAAAAINANITAMDNLRYVYP